MVVPTPELEVSDGTATWVDGDVDGASGDAVAGRAAGSSRDRAGSVGDPYDNALAETANGL